MKNDKVILRRKDLKDTVKFKNFEEITSKDFDINFNYKKKYYFIDNGKKKRIYIQSDLFKRS